MLNFVNTEIVGEGLSIGVGVYYVNFEKASKLIDDLIKLEKVIQDCKGKDRREVIINKNGYNVKLYTILMSDNARGYKHHYSFIDENSFSEDYGLEFLKTRIYSSTVDYNMKAEYRGYYEPRLLLY